IFAIPSIRGVAMIQHRSRTRSQRARHNRRAIREPRARLSLEPLEDRVVLDAGDTLASALHTGLGPAAGTFFQPIETIGDNAYGSNDVDIYQFDAAAGQALIVQPGSDYFTMRRLFDSFGNQLAVSYYGLLTYTFGAPGTYYVGVSSLYNAYY